MISQGNRRERQSAALTTGSSGATTASSEFFSAVAAVTDLHDMIEAAGHRDEVKLDLRRLNGRLRRRQRCEATDSTRRRMSASLTHSSA